MEGACSRDKAAGDAGVTRDKAIPGSHQERGKSEASDSGQVWAILTTDMIQAKFGEL